MQSDYFGIIEEDWVGISSEYKFSIPYFEKEVEVFLGSHIDSDGEERKTLPTDNKLIQYEETLKSFLENIDETINQIKEKAFENYKEFYAEHYEKEFILDGLFETDEEEGRTHKPLNICSKDIHFEYMKDINILRVLNDKKILLEIFYKLDSEHGLEILLQENKVISISGLGDHWTIQ